MEDFKEYSGDCDYLMIIILFISFNDDVYYFRHLSVDPLSPKRDQHQCSPDSNINT